MLRKAFHISVDIDIHAVTCPGVWLCPRGDAMVRISMLGASAHTARLEPSFPLLFHEGFHFRKTLTRITGLAELQAELSRRHVLLQLLQSQVHNSRCVLLATFRSPLSDLLYPQSASRALITGVDVDLLMETTSCFPGIIAPKVEVSTRVVIEEMVNHPLHTDTAIVTHKTLTSKRMVPQREGKTDKKIKGKNSVSSGYQSRIRQKPVCHTRPSVRCYSCKQRVRRGSGEGPCCAPAPIKETIYIPYCNKCRDAVKENGMNQGKILLKEDSESIERWEAACPCAVPPRAKSVCDCGLCRRYQNYFKSSPPISPHSNCKTKLDCCTSVNKKGNCCPCLDDSSGESATRLRADCHCACCSNQDSSAEDNREGVNVTLKRDPAKGEEYRKIFSADLDSNYKKLYDRVSRRSIRREL